MGSRFEWHMGIGVNLFNHIRFDQSWIISPEGFMKGLVQKFDEGNDGATGARHGQWQLALSVTLGGWSEKDRNWWQGNDEREWW